MLRCSGRLTGCNNFHPGLYQPYETEAPPGVPSIVEVLALRMSSASEGKEHMPIFIFSTWIPAEKVDSQVLTNVEAHFQDLDKNGPGLMSTVDLAKLPGVQRTCQSGPLQPFQSMRRQNVHSG